MDDHVVDKSNRPPPHPPPSYPSPRPPSLLRSAAPSPRPHPISPPLLLHRPTPLPNSTSLMSHFQPPAPPCSKNDVGCIEDAECCSGQCVTDPFVLSAFCVPFTCNEGNTQCIEPSECCSGLCVHDPFVQSTFCVPRLAEADNTPVAYNPSRYSNAPPSIFTQPVAVTTAFAHAPPSPHPLV